MTHRILITGASGQVGTEVVRLAPTFGFDPIGLTSQNLDISDRDAVQKVVGNTSPAAVINCAAYTAVDKAESEPERAYAVNRDGVQFLAEACAAQKIPLLHISTDYIFPGTGSTPFKINASTAPTSIYGHSKLAGEEILRATHTDHIILRTAWVYAAHGKNFIRTMLRLAMERGSVSVVNDQYGSPTNAQDIAQTLLSITARQLSADKEPYGTHHYTGKGVTTWHGFACVIFSELEKLTGKSVELNAIPTSAFPTPAKRPEYSALDCSKLAEVFDIETVEWQQRVRAVTKALIEVDYPNEMIRN